jgi:cytochrome c peroxidase
MRTVLLSAAWVVMVVIGAWMSGPTVAQADEAWVTSNPIKPLPMPPLGIDRKFEDLEKAPTPQSVRLGRWLFYDPRMSLDGTVSCATCHRPEHGFSEPTPVSTGVGGKKGGRKAPPVLNAAWPVAPFFFWDGRADTLEAQAIGPMINPVEMAMADHAVVVQRIGAIKGYAPYFKEVFGDEKVTLERIAKAIADYERTRMSGNSPWDRWQAEPDAGDADVAKALTAWQTPDEYAEGPRGPMPQFKDGKHVSAKVKLGSHLFFGKAGCNQCHLGINLSDSQFHNLGVGWQPDKKEFKDIGRYAISKKEEDKGAFKTPTVREVKSRAPYMHDGTVATLREVVELYNKGGEANPWLSGKIKPLNLTSEEVDALVAFMEALSGEGYQDTAPKLPQ